MLYKKNCKALLYKLTGIRRDCFVPRNDVSFSFGLFAFRTSGYSFTFHLSPFTLIAALCFVLSTLGLTSCSLNPSLQGKGETYIQGQWQQDSTGLQQKLVTAEQYHMKFDCDSFYVSIHSYSKINYANDSCMRSGKWVEYLKGTYAQKSDTLFLKGQFCNADFSIKNNTDCLRAGTYEEFFKVNKKTDSLIQLSGTASVIPINLHLIKRTSCTQKPL
jgi:hypothetical protein